ncbi:helix-turn-helix domain-containing protein [Spiroplasma endosymbiont of Nephrotoma flavescens]
MAKVNLRSFYIGYKHLGIDERIYIENQLKFKVKISEIAKNLNRSISTI